MNQKKSIIFTFSSLLLIFLNETANAQPQNSNCPDSHLDYGAVCKNEGTIINNYYIQNQHLATPASPSFTFKKPRDPFVVERQPTPQEALTSDEEPPKYPTFPNNSMFRVQKQ